MKIAGFQMLAIQLEEKLHKNLPLGRAAVARLVSHNYSITQTPLGHWFHYILLFLSSVKFFKDSILLIKPTAILNML